MSNVNHESKVIFIHVPKTAGTPMQEKPFIGGSGHESIFEFKYMLPPEVFSSYFKFGFVRNPWDRLVSAYHFLVQMKEDHKLYKYDAGWVRTLRQFASLNDFVKSFAFSVALHQGDHFPSQVSLLFDESGNLAVDFVGRFENLDQDWRYVCQRIGVEENTELPRCNTSKHEHYSVYYDAEAREIVGRAYEADLRAFSYTWEG